MLQDRFSLYLSREAVEAVKLPMGRIIELVEFSLVEKAHDRVQMPAKHWMEPRETRWFGGMSSLVPAIGYAAMKWQSGSSENPAKGLPYLTGMLFLNNLDDGLVGAIMDSTWITQQRTAAESAVAVKYLARPGASEYTMIGCGVQARSHLEAFRLVMPDLRRVVVFDINTGAAEAFRREAEAQGVSVTVARTPREAVEATDIVVTGGPIEPTAQRVIEPGWLHAGHLGITLDYDCYWKPEAIAAAHLLVTDDFSQIEHVKEFGYFVKAPKPQVELGAIAARLHPGRQSDDEIIVSLNMGVAVEDVATAKEVYELARSRELGIRLPF